MKYSKVIRTNKRVSYRQSRCVKLVSKKLPDHGKPTAFHELVVKKRRYGFPNSHRRRRRPSKTTSKCPSAPHNTTSFLINYHKGETGYAKDSLSEFLEALELQICPMGSFFRSVGCSSYDDSSEAAPEQ
ncbi:hypothetical protein EON65_30120 [archaeon]|nr:MAG: hypothetical protein EON65_30120 [archaeon]